MNTSSFKKLLTAPAKIFVLSLLSVALLSGSASALSGSEFKAGRIIDDAYFYNGNTMSVTEIQNFLNAKVPTCDTWGTQPYGGTTRAEYGASRGYPAPYTCLKSYKQDTGYKAGQSGLCSAIEAKTGRTAAQIIDDVANACHISEKVILVMLQKEQGLVTDDWPWSIQYRGAMGYGCPDTAPCDAEYYGFFNQVYNAALQFQRYKADPTYWNHVPFMTNQVQYQANAPSCGSRSTYIENYATAGLYNYTPYTPNQAALDNLYGSAPTNGSIGGSGDPHPNNDGDCSAYGNRNFWRYYNDWFGPTLAPSTFRAENSSTVYVMIGGYKVAIPAMYTLQDYGYDPNKIAVISASSNNAIPSPPSGSGVSANLGHIIKSTSDTDADGGSVYFVSVGFKYPITSMDQFNKYGFDTSKITYLPLSYIQTIKTGTALSDFLKVPDGTIFNVSNAQKRLIFSNTTHTAINHNGTVNPVSAGSASLVTSGNPYSDGKAVFLKKSSSQAVYAYNNDEYHAVSWDSYNCWGVGALADRPLRTINPNYLPSSITTTSSLGCIYKDGTGNVQALSKTKRIPVPVAYGIGGGATQPAANMTNLYNNTPLSTSQLKRLVKSNSSSTVWYLEGGYKKPIPTLSNFELLGGINQLDKIESGIISQTPQGIVKLGNGQPVKNSSSSAVYIVNGPARYLVPSAELYTALRHSWGNIETYDSTYLDTNYPSATSPVNPYLYVTAVDKVYLMDKNSCYSLTSALLPSYGKSQETIKSSQPYGSSIAPHSDFSKCKTGTDYIKSDSSGTVYKLESGTKRSISTWAKLVELNGGSAPTITTLSPVRVNEFPNGPAY